jgi:uncharacterized membrane protein
VYRVGETMELGTKQTVGTFIVLIAGIFLESIYPYPIYGVYFVPILIILIGWSILFLMHILPIEEEKKEDQPKKEVKKEYI